MTDLPEQLPDARAVLAAAYGRARAADAANEDSACSDWDTEHERQQAQALAAIGAGLATVEAAEKFGGLNIHRNLAETGRRLAAVEDAQYAAGSADLGLRRRLRTRVIDAWEGLNYSARGSVQRAAPTLANALNDAADRTDAERCASVARGCGCRCERSAGHGGAHHCHVEQSPSDDPTGGPTGGAEQVQPLPPVDNVAGCDATDLGRRCVRLAGHEDGHLFPPLVPAGSDRFA